jgi:hypothetical protein
MNYVKIIENAFTPLMGNVLCGQFFKSEGHLCVRTSSNSSGQWEAFDFETRERIWIPHTNRVTLVHCEISYKYVEDPKD